MSHPGASHHPSYHNRFRSPSTDGDDDVVTSPAEPQPHGLSDHVDVFGHPANFGQLELSDSALAEQQQQQQQQQQESEQNRKISTNSQHEPGRKISSSSQHNQVGQYRKISNASQHQPTGPFRKISNTSQQLPTGPFRKVSNTSQPRGSVDVTSSGQLVTVQSGVALDVRRTSVDESGMRPMAPGLPRRLSRQHSAEDRRLQFAAAASGEGRRIVTSADSGCDDVFVEMTGEREGAGVHGHQHALHDSSLFPDRKRAHSTFSATSTASILPNPYNRLNHRIHDMVWCCSCVSFVFFCCLPAIHFMEQSDVEHNRHNSKRARSLGRLSTFLYFTGTLIALSLFSLIFFLVIFFNIN